MKYVSTVGRSIYVLQILFSWSSDVYLIKCVSVSRVARFSSKYHQQRTSRARTSAIGSVLDLCLSWLRVRSKVPPSLLLKPKRKYAFVTQRLYALFILNHGNSMGPYRIWETCFDLMLDDRGVALWWLPAATLAPDPHRCFTHAQRKTGGIHVYLPSHAQWGQRRVCTPDCGISVMRVLVLYFFLRIFYWWIAALVA